MERASPSGTRRPPPASPRSTSPTSSSGEPIPGIATEYALYQALVPGIRSRRSTAWRASGSPTTTGWCWSAHPRRRARACPTSRRSLAVFAAAEHAPVRAYADSRLRRAAGAGPRRPRPRHRARRASPEIGVTRVDAEQRRAGDAQAHRLQGRTRSSSPPSSPGGTSLASDSDYVAALTAAAGGAGGRARRAERHRAAQAARGQGGAGAAPTSPTTREGLSGAPRRGPGDALPARLPQVHRPARRQRGLRGATREPARRPRQPGRQPGEGRSRLAARDPRAAPPPRAALHAGHRSTRWTCAARSTSTASASPTRATSPSPSWAASSPTRCARSWSATWRAARARAGRGGARPRHRYPRGVVRRDVRRGIEPKAPPQLVFTGPFDFDADELYDLNARRRSCSPSACARTCARS